MWINRQAFDAMVAQIKTLDFQVNVANQLTGEMSGRAIVLREQKAKDDITIDWMRHRINSLERLNAQLLLKAAGIHVSVPEIVVDRPGTMTPSLPEAFAASMPSFEDIGDAEAARLGIRHDKAGNLEYREDGEKAE